MAGDRLEGLDLTEHYGLTDASLSSIRQYSVNLRSLSLAKLKHLTETGLEALFTFVENMTAPPMLRHVDLADCDHQAVTDQVLRLITEGATKRPVVGQGALQQQPHQPHPISTTQLVGLTHLNIQGASLITDTAMESIAATCACFLQEMNVSFCTRISDQGLGYLVDPCAAQLTRIHVYGNAQLTEEFVDGNRRATDPTFEITGVWMKKSSDRTQR